MDDDFFLWELHWLQFPFACSVPCQVGSIANHLGIFVMFYSSPLKRGGGFSPIKLRDAKPDTVLYLEEVEVAL